MTTQLAEAIDALVVLGWPCDPTDVSPPCWYTLCLRDRPGPGRDSDYEPCNLHDRSGMLWIYPTGDLRLEVEVKPSGSLGQVSIETLGAPGSRLGEQTLHTGPWEDLKTHVRQAGICYLQATALATGGRRHG